MGNRQQDPTRMARLSADELSILCEQIALIVRSGLPLHDGVEALCDNYRNTRYAARFQKLRDAVLATGSLYRGLVDAGIFPSYLREMANIGERTGELDTVMSGLALYYQREAKLRRAVVNASPIR
jgi:type IV pilus assembly protein PilC